MVFLVHINQLHKVGIQYDVVSAHMSLPYILN